MDIPDLFLCVSLTLCLWLLYRNDTVCKYRFALIDVDIDAYKNGDSYEIMLCNPIKYPVSKMKKFINDRNS